MEVSRAPAGPEQPAEPFEITGPHMTGRLVLKATRAIFIGDIPNVALKCLQPANQHLHLTSMVALAGGLISKV